MELWREVLLFQARERHIETEGQKIQKINFKQIIFLLLLLSILFVCIYNLWCFHTHYYRTSSMPVGGNHQLPTHLRGTQFRPAGFIALPLDAGLPSHRCSAAYQLPSGKMMAHLLGSFAVKLPSGKMMSRP